MPDGFRYIALTDPEWGLIKLRVVTPRGGDPWGVLAPLRDTEWGEQIQVVSAESLSHALHGWATPLMKEIGVPPKVHANRISAEAGTCDLINNCIGAGPNCRPGVDVPGCYMAPKFKPELGLLASAITLAWAEGCYVLVAEGKGFNLN